nr:CpsB/CapC family capsule biosynthesis tyrosine phosphatase [Lapidilactobacillus luobeiensis]
MAIMDTGTATKVRRNSLVDLHCHILPGIDDGSPDLATSLELAQTAVREGIGYILATPHHLDRQYINHRADVEQAVTKFQHELDQAQIPLTIFAGQEVHLNGDLAKRLPDLLGIDENMHYMLVEFPHQEVPTYTKELFFQLNCQDIIPVIAHPERNAQILKQPEILYELETEGALAQLTATSLVGGFGKKLRKFSIDLVKHGLVQVVASDAHALKNRKFALREAYLALDEIDRDFGPIFFENSKHLLNGEILNQQISLQPIRKHSWWQK